MRRCLFLMGLLMLLLVVGCSQEEGSEQKEQADQPRTAQEQTTAPETTRESGKAEDAALAVGETVELEGMSLRVFGIRSEETAYYMPGPGDAPGSQDSSFGEYLAIDYIVENDSGSTATLRAEATLKDAQNNSHAPDPSIDSPGTSFDGLQLEPESKRASTAFFDVPSDITPERLLLTFSGEEAEIDLTDDERSEIPPEDYLYVYHEYFNQRAYEEAYGMLEGPKRNHGITLGEWLTFYEPLWGERYISLDSVEPLSSGSDEATFLMERTFYGGDGTQIPDAEINANAEQRVVKEAEEWKIVMREDLAQDILATSEPSVPEAVEGEDEEPLEDAERELGSSATDQYDTEEAEEARRVTVPRAIR